MPARYVAMGDSYCAGLAGDGFPPWPPRVAEHLRRDDPDLEFVNLGRHGATSSQVLSCQMPLSVEYEPDLVTVCCGANDVLDSVVPDMAAFAHNLKVLLAELRDGADGATVITLTYGTFAPYAPYRQRSRRRVAAGMERVNELIRELSREARCCCVDVAAMPEGTWADSFGSDGIHASDLGHHRTAQAVTAALRARVGVARPD